jgi:hypothetical protein
MAEPRLPLPSIGALLRTTRVVGREGRSFSTRVHLHGVVHVDDEGAYLVDLLADWESPGGYESLLSPGLYRVVTLREVEEADNDGQLATCAYREGTSVARWEADPKGYGSDTRCLALITRSALSRWAEAVDRELAQLRQEGGGGLTSAAFPIWNETCELGVWLAAPGPALRRLGLRFNDPEGGDAVCLPAKLWADVFWGLDASGRRVAMMCGWEDFVAADAGPAAE